MPSQQEVRWSQLKVGVIVAISLTLLIVLIFLLTSVQGTSLFSKKITVHTYFENSAGLKEGAPVNLQGVTIGNVTKVQVVNTPERKLTPVEAIMKLDSKFQPMRKRKYCNCNARLRTQLVHHLSMMASMTVAR